MATYYTTRGSVRQSRNHKHRNIGTAVHCLLRDQVGCAKFGGYSDRAIIAIEDGERRELTPAEHDEWQFSAEYSQQ